MSTKTPRCFGSWMAKANICQLKSKQEKKPVSFKLFPLNLVKGMYYNVAIKMRQWLAASTEGAEVIEGAREGEEMM